MAYDEATAALLLADLAPRGDLSTRRMFGGLCLMRAGHMVAGTYGGKAMFRVGKPNQSAALAVPGVTPLAMAGRPMTGFVEVDGAAIADPALRARLLGLALAFVATLPPKTRNGGG